ncbi:MAG: RNA polymerase factor sigma-54 [Thermodesulfobacteriota bacterium]|nr:RNA polymerase factor sigma-54 [Thermodesulfobacteriota bacterium]
MTLELRQSVVLAQQLLMTPQMQQAIKLLQLSRLELLDTIHQEIENNPVLEEQMAEEEAEDTGIEDEGSESEQEIPDLPEVTVEEQARDDVDWDNYLSEYNTGRAELPFEEKDFPSFENTISQKTNLHDHLMWQMNLSNLDDEQKQVGAHIIGNLDEDGYLDISLEDICQVTECPLEEMLETLKVIQNFDPVGVAARDLQESLLIQARFQNLGGTIVEKIIIDHLGDLEVRKYDKISQKLSVPLQVILSAISIIQGFDPRPGSSYSDNETFYITPDIYIVNLGDEYKVFQNDDGLPKLHVSPYYKEILHNKNSVSENARAYIQEKLKSAAWLIKSIHQRQRTIWRVTESIVRFQKDFLDKGIVHLKPLVLRDVAEDIGMHESTVSRITTNKYVHTPQGLFELKFFFNSSISSVHGEAVASERVRQEIGTIIRGEDKAKPYSDKEIREIMREQNINIARRTVAKYRESMGILSSRKRENPY